MSVCISCCFVSVYTSETGVTSYDCTYLNMCDRCNVNISYIFLKLFKSFRYQNKNCADMVNSRWCIVCISIHQSIHLFYPSSICSPSSRRTCVGINKHSPPSPLRKPHKFRLFLSQSFSTIEIWYRMCVGALVGCGCANISIYIYFENPIQRLLYLS